jgi:4a-hydroxytetrahydrobiopterin dehydratase
MEGSFSQLAGMKCVACRSSEPTVTQHELADLLPQIPGWQLVERESTLRLERVYKFKNFAGAISFTNQIGQIAEQEGHHPAILTEWGKVTVTWWTHKIKGLHHNDFIMAAKTDELYGEMGYH